MGIRFCCNFHSFSTAFSMRFFLLIFLTALLTLLAFSCKESPTESERKIKSPREMVWTADTLKMPGTAIQLLPNDMLPISKNNIWLAVWVGHGQIWHKDESGWSVVEDIGGEINCFAKRNDSDLWAGGRIGRSDGNNVVVANYKLGKWNWNEMNVKSELLAMSKDDQNSIWSCGRSGIIMRYKNDNWLIEIIKTDYMKNYPDAQFLLNSIEYFGNEIYLQGAVLDSKRGKNIYYMFKGTFNNWNLVDSIVLSSPASIIEWGNWGLQKSEDNDMYSYGLQGIWKFENNQWVKHYHLDGEMYGMYALNKNYILAVSAFNKIFFYDGTNWQSISDIFKNKNPYFVFNKVTMVGDEIYVCGYGTINNKDVVIIWHGE